MAHGNGGGRGRSKATRMGGLLTGALRTQGVSQSWLACFLCDDGYSFSHVSRKKIHLGVNAYLCA
jgi:hypothetical protein